MKSTVELNRLLLKFLLLCYVDIQESSCKGNAKFNFLGIIWQSRAWQIACTVMSMHAMCTQRDSHMYEITCL